MAAGRRRRVRPVAGRDGGRVGVTPAGENLVDQALPVDRLREGKADFDVTEELPADAIGIERQSVHRRGHVGDTLDFLAVRSGPDDERLVGTACGHVRAVGTPGNAVDGERVAGQILLLLGKSTRRRQGRHTPRSLTGNVENFPACGEDRQIGARFEEGIGNLGGGLK